jgi:hypothetical protein
MTASAVVFSPTLRRLIAALRRSRNRDRQIAIYSGTSASNRR